MATQKMLFKVGVVRWTKTAGWTHEYGIFRLEHDSMLGDMPGSYRDESVMEMFGLREDQPEYDRVTCFEELRDAMDKEPGCH